MASEKRARQKANRAEARRLRERAERRARLLRGGRRALIIGLLVVGVGVVAGLLGNRGDSGTTTTTGASAATTAPEGTGEPTTTTTGEGGPMDGTVQSDAYLAFRSMEVACGGPVAEPALEMSFDEPEDQGIAADAVVTATIVTSCGPIELTLFPDRAPMAVNSFAFLARQGYFNGTVSHRIAPGFVFQAGDPTATGRGGPGYRFEDELPAADFTYIRGVVAMANSGPNTNGSQFFIVLQDAGLGPDFTVFGEVADGLDVLERLEAVPVAGDSPQQAVYLELVEIEVG